MSAPRKSKKKPEVKNANPFRELGLILGGFALLVGLIYAGFEMTGSKSTIKRRSVATSLPKPGQVSVAQVTGQAKPKLPDAFTNFWSASNRVLYWWDQVPEPIAAGSVDTGEVSNIRHADYAGPESCKECHPGNYGAWLGHSHRFMNVFATPETVKGDFTGTAEIDYLGGKGTFYKRGDKYVMQLKRETVTRVYEITRTIGSRFYQYYVGKLIEGPEKPESPYRKEEHVLAFGYWLDKKQWVPTVHVFRDTRDDDDNYDPFAPTEYAPYDSACASCHTTIPAGDWLLRYEGVRQVSNYTPRPLLFDVPSFLKEAHPEILEHAVKTSAKPEQVVDRVGEIFTDISVPATAATMGISCEACHHGSAQHIAASTKEDSKLLPSFFPASPHIYTRGKDKEEILSKTELNQNFVCSKCHSGYRQPFASGHHTWNSTEYTDAVNGACYDHRKTPSGMKSLTCTHCHDPHEGIGKKWKLTEKQNDSKCLTCHEQFKEPAALASHTHHLAESSGSSCMNCHMPKINEGLQDMVRTHRIFSPTEPTMIAQNQPNACNLCHLDKPIDWTVKHLREWYDGKPTVSEADLAANYPERDGPVGVGWLKSSHAPTRLAAAEALALSNSRWALPGLVDMLDDNKLINRQFTQNRLEAMLGTSLRARGYQFYMTADERRDILRELRQELLKDSGE